MKAAADQESKGQSDVVGTLMSLTVAFTLAMGFRGFVLEGFVIPTGSMGPTLMGAHVRIDSPVTGFEYASDASPIVTSGFPAFPQVDPMISQRMPIGLMERTELAANVRAGDRVLVLKPLFLVSQPQRWDVVVFKNPTDPVGDAQNFIKRLVGLPNETFLIVDGDVFTGPPGASSDALKIERKPEYVQRAVWQPIYNSDYEPVKSIATLESGMRAEWPGPPWKARGPNAAKWQGVAPASNQPPQRAWTFAGPGKATLEWDIAAWPVDDWNSYNALRFAEDAGTGTNAMATFTNPAWRSQRVYGVRDLRLTASVECADMAGFSTEFALTAGRHLLRFTVQGDGHARVQREESEGGNVLGTAEFAFTPSSDGFLALEFWHVDQQLWVFVNGRVVGQWPYEFASLSERIASASKYNRTVEQHVANPIDPNGPSAPGLSWTFESRAPFTLNRVRVDRDLYYRPVMHDQRNQFPMNGEFVTGAGFGTDWNNPARLGPDDFLMLGDNSSHSRDSRLWGRAHKLALTTFGDAQPGVVPRQMIVGKAWCVYFPAPMPLSSGGTTIIPDFGRLRFIR